MKLTTEQKKDEIVSLAIANKAEMNLNGTYNNRALDLFFVLWRK